MQLTPGQWLETEYLKRRKKNQAYSLRAFARLLDLPSGRVSQLLSRKRNFTPELGRKIAVQLSFDPVTAQHFLASIAGTRTKKQPAAPSRELAALPMDQFEAIADPVHFAILSLLETKSFSGLEKDIALRLGLDVVEARAASDRLTRLGLTRMDARGRLRLASSSPGLATSHDVQSAALRRSHRKVIQEAEAALEEVAVELRDITSITMAIDPTRLPEAKEKLRSLRRSMCEFLESGNQTEVYRLNVQLVPVTKRKKS